MSSLEPHSSSPGEIERSSWRIRRVLSGSRELVRLVYRDPEHVPERLMLVALERLGDESGEWARSVRDARTDASRAQIAEELRARSAQIARIDGAIAGTPFFLALIPGYLTYLWQEMRMTLRTAALFGRDPRQLRTAAEMLALRGVHPSIESAHAALAHVRESGTPKRPAARRSLRTWVSSVYSLLVFGGFMSPSAAKPRNGILDWARAVLSIVLAAALWVLTALLPVTFMIVMAWDCETHARQLGRRALLFYESETASVTAAIAAADQRQDRGHDRRTILRTLALSLSVIIPIAFISLVVHFGKTTGLTWLAAVGSLVALSLVIATVVASNRR